MSGIFDNQVQSKSKIPDFEREPIEVGNHSNSVPISMIDHLDPTQRLDLRGGFEMTSNHPAEMADIRQSSARHRPQPGSTSDSFS
jgi:hypothetical protein